MNYADNLWIALLVGVAFGAALERAGLGNAQKLAGQFYFKDFTVFKVMMSAIVTAMLGAFWLSWLGVIDMGALYVPETYLAPQVVGGLIFGVGFVISGLCPGTSCVSAASGKGDGVAVGVGLLGGVVATGLAFPLLEGFYNSSAKGAFILPDLLGVPYGLVVAGVAAMAVGMFVAIERFEKR